MLSNGQKLSIASANEWPHPQRMGEILLIQGNNSSSENKKNDNNNNNNNNASTATSSSNSSTSTNSNNNMIHTAAAGPSAVGVMDRPPQEQQAALKCPRCDSSNTKFCYYNNYSLSQPRHFCKACKRYWTRGGTLRNVPVGGGCRKNKRVKKPASIAVSTAPSDLHPASLMHPKNSINPPISLPNPTSHAGASINTLFYSLPSAPPPLSSSSSDMGLAFSGLRPTSVPIFDLQQPQFNSLGLVFPSSQRDNEFNLGQLQASASVMNDYPLFGSTAASLLVSSLKQPKKVDDYDALMPYDDLQEAAAAAAAAAAANGNWGMIKDVKLEGEGNAIDNNMIEWQIPCENSFDAIGSVASSAFAGDSSFLYWNAAVGAWPDPTNFGSSLAPLI